MTDSPWRRVTTFSCPARRGVGLNRSIQSKMAAAALCSRTSFSRAAAAARLWASANGSHRPLVRTVLCLLSFRLFCNPLHIASRMPEFVILTLSTRIPDTMSLGKMRKCHQTTYATKLMTPDKNGKKTREQ